MVELFDMKVAKSVYSDLYYFHDSNFERSNGERYYVINIKDKVENHYTSLTQLFISFDGEICVEGYTSDQKIYVYNGDNILIKIKTLQVKLIDDIISIMYKTVP